MNYRLFIFIIIFSSLNHSCTFNCVESSIIDLKKETGFDYYRYTKELESFMLKTGIIDDTSKRSYVEVFENREYCDILYNDMVKELDNSLATAPRIGEIFINCGGKSNVSFKFLNIDSLINEPNRYMVNFVEEISDSEFQNKDVKAFLVYQISVLQGTCVD